MDIERELRAALRPQEPGPDFTATVLRRVQQGDAVLSSTAYSDAARADVAGKSAAGARPFRSWRIPVSLAASVALAFIGVRLIGYQQQHDQAAYAHQQLVMALTITSNELAQLQQKLSPHNAQENGT
jgi:hypothetical protein